jgi:hypothetical protein
MPVAKSLVVPFTEIGEYCIRQAIFDSYMRGWMDSLCRELEAGIIDLSQWDLDPSDLADLPERSLREILMEEVEYQFDSASSLDPRSHMVILKRNGLRTWVPAVTIRSQRTCLSDGGYPDGFNWYDATGHGRGLPPGNGNVLVCYAVTASPDPACRIPGDVRAIIEERKEYAAREGLDHLDTLSPLSGFAEFRARHGNCTIDDYLKRNVMPPRDEREDASIRDPVGMHLHFGASLERIWPGYKLHPGSGGWGATTRYI